MEQHGLKSPIKHNHMKCMELAGDHTVSRAMTQQHVEMLSVRPSNVLMYVRKSSDIDDILDVLRDCVIYISDTMMS